MAEILNDSFYYRSFFFLFLSFGVTETELKFMSLPLKQITSFITEVMELKFMLLPLKHITPFIIKVMELKFTSLLLK